MNTQQIRMIRRKLKDWYEINKRTLPWRETKEAYKIWISEIILQQTRVNQGLAYYLRFTERFPDVKSLAKVEEQEVLKYWQGLGYYSRARNLHKAAGIVASKFNGVFPDNYKDIISLPGIGEYTAAAISSFAYNLPYATVDGNIFRVISRLTANDTPIDTGRGKKWFTDTAQTLLDPRNPGLHNQAIMEFGALYCTPGVPECEECPIGEYCKAFKLDLVNQLPVKQGKTITTNRYFNYFFIQTDVCTFLQKRTKKDIWQNLYEFPLIETDKSMAFGELQKTEEFRKLFGNKEFRIESISKNFKHILSHRIIYATFYSIHISEATRLTKDFEKIPLNKISLFPISRLTELFLEEK